MHQQIIFKGKTQVHFFLHEFQIGKNVKVSWNLMEGLNFNNFDIQVTFSNPTSIILGGCKVGWLTFYVAIQFFAKWRAFTCY
jgi:hypothetical protein